ncbi:hypothetical protein HHK36_028625 [Tetracentron sinense]|uniref:Uncharacterized protein n=1 Tax=Tetracentron sinense TaxID=13715 RepID=A0A835D2S8_TETSI|nr:hypothetical protein HHK36_028625 [Tetracentron sinense]
MDQRLIDIAEAGDIDALYALLHQNPYVLEKVDRVPFVSTPLHVAVSAGQTRFTKEIISLKPFFARKLNQDGNSPIHLASTKGHLEIVRELLKIGDDLCLLKGREKRIPLHSAAIAGSILVLGELLKACPESLGELTVRGETALHLSVKNNQFEAFKLLLEWHKNLHEWEVDASALQLVQKSIKPESLKVLMERLKQINKEEFKRTIYSLVLKNHEWEAFRILRGKIKQIKKEDVVSWKDDEGNTVLHLAVSIKQRQAKT